MFTIVPLSCFLIVGITVLVVLITKTFASTAVLSPQGLILQVNQTSHSPRY
jgi:hypothetical protein